MSRFLSSADQELFDSEVKHEYQARGSEIGPYAKRRTGVVGGVYHFRRMGKGQAIERTAPQVDVTPMDINHHLIPVTLLDFEAPEYSDVWDSAEVNFEERNELAVTIAGALGRREDQLLIDALDSATIPPGQSAAFNSTITTAEGGADTNLNVAKLRAAKRDLDAKDVPKNDRCFLCHSNNLYGLLGETEATSQDLEYRSLAA